MSSHPSPFCHLLGEEPAPDAGLNALDGAMLATALREARRGVGRTFPNPPVGAVVARADQMLASGFHARAGDRHAEIVALDQLTPGAARGATLYVTLEPCVHHGRTPPCVDRVIAEGIARVVVGAVDPNPKVHEHGLAALRAAGIRVDVATGALGAACRSLIAPFASGFVVGRPWVCLKVAASLDGRVAAASGSSRWITGERARQVVHELRNAVDVVMVGAGTVIADDPQLTVRMAVAAQDARDPRRVVIDGALRTSPRARVFAPPAADGMPGPLVVHGRASIERETAFDAAGVERLRCEAEGGRVDLVAAFAAMRSRAHSVLVEAGPGLATALWRAGLVDELWWFTAPFLLGGDGIPAIGPLGLSTPSEALRWLPMHRALGEPDSLVVMRPSIASL